MTIASRVQEALWARPDDRARRDGLAVTASPSGWSRTYRHPRPAAVATVAQTTDWSTAA
jgi:hypothetical protein